MLRIVGGGLVGGLVFGLIGLLASEVGRSVTSVPPEAPEGSAWNLYLYNGYPFIAAIGVAFGAVLLWSSLPSVPPGRSVLRYACGGAALGLTLILLIFELGRGAGYIKNPGQDAAMPMRSREKWRSEWLGFTPLFVFVGVGALIGRTRKT